MQGLWPIDTFVISLLHLTIRFIAVEERKDNIALEMFWWTCSKDPESFFFPV